MITVSFTPNLKRHLACPPRQFEGANVGDLLAQVFADNPKLEGYILDDQGHLRKHVVVFVDGRRIRDRQRLSDTLDADAEVFVLQALSGG